MRVTFFKFGKLIPTLSVVLSFALAGCQTPDSNQLSSLTGLTSSSTPIPADNVGSGKVLLISGGNNQTIDQNSPAPNSLDVIALDNLGAPIPNLTIGYMITSGGGSLTGGGITAVTTTNDNGIASMGYASGSAIGQTTIIATSSAGSTSFTITVGLSTNSSAGGALLLATNGNNQLVAKNTSASRTLEVLALNNLGNAIPSLPVTFKILTSNAGTLTGGSNSASVATDGNGRASIAFTAGTQTGSVSIIATSSAGSAVFNLTVNDSGTLSSLTIASGNGQSIAPNAAASLPLEVIATGADGSPISGIVVSFSVSTQNGGTVSNATVTTGANGRASTNFTSGTATGTINVLAASNLGSTTFSISVNQPGTTGATSAMLLASSGNNQTIQPSATAPKSLEVTALNSLGVPMPGVAVKFEVITSGAGNVTGGTTIANVITNANGRASTNFTASAQSGAVSVIATSTAGSAVFTVTVNQPGATSTSSGSTLLITSGNNQSLNPSTLAPKNLEVMAVNSLGIPMAGIPVSFEVVTTGGGTLTSGGSSETMNTAANGRASISFTSGTQTGSISVIATSSAGNAVFTLNVGASTNSVAAGSMLLVTNGNGQAVLQGTTATKNLEVMAVNNLGVPMAGIPITFEILTASAGTLTGSATTATSTTGANGRASVSYTASNTLGPVTVIATSTAGSAVFNLVINATGTGSSLTISGGNGQTLAPNSASTTPLEVFVSNTSGAAVSGVSVTFTVTTTNGGLVSNGTTAITTTTNANGKASTTFQSGSATGNIAVLASSSAGSATFNVNVTNPGSNQNANATLLVSNGNNQSFEQGTAAPKSLEVMAIDSLGNPISGLQVGYTLLTSGAGTLTGGAATASATTGVNGRASIGFTASSQTGAVSIVATSTAGSAVFNLNVNPTGTGTILSISSGNNQTLAPNATANIPFEVIATNASGNPVANVPVTFTITTLNSGNVTGGSSSVTVNTNANGKASTTYTAGSNPGSVSVLASAISGSVLFNVNVQNAGSNSSSASMVLVTNGHNQTVEQGATAAKSLEVMAVSSLGTPISGVTFNFQVLSSGAGTLTGGNITATATTGANGRASVNYTATSQLGQATIIASSTSGSAVFNVTTIAAGTGSVLSIASGNGQSMNPNAASALPLEVIATNSAGSPVAGVDVTFTVTTANGGTLSNSTATVTATTGANGKASTTFTASSTTGTIAVLASSVSGSVVFNLNVANSGVNSSTGSILLVTGGNTQSVEQSASAAKSLEVLAVNSLGSAVSGVSVTFKVLTSGGGTLTGGGTTASATTDANGRASVAYTAGTQNGPVTVMATSSAGSAVFNLDVIPVGSASMLTISNGNNQVVAPSAAAATPLEVIVTNRSGTPVEGITVNFSVTTANGGSVSAASATTDADGKASTNFTAGNVNKNVSVLASSLSGSAVFNVVVASSSISSSNASSILVTNGNNQSVEQGTTAAKTLEVTAVNNQGNAIGGVVITYKVMTSGAGTLTGGGTTATATTAANGTASVAFTASSQTGPVSIMATSSSGSAVFNLTTTASGTGSVISISSGNGQSITPSTEAPIPLEVIATNSAGSPVAGITVNFSVTTASGGSLSASSATTGANGKASTTFTSSSTTGNIAVLASTSNGSAVFNVNVATAGSSSAAGALLLATSGNNQSVEQGTAAAKPLEVMAVNSLGNPMSSLTITYKVLTSGAGIVTGGATTGTATTDANGRASIVFTASSQTGPVAILASSTAGSTVFNLNTIPSGTGSTITISSGSGQTVTPSTQASIPLEIIATNSAGAPVAGLSVSFAVTTASGGSLSVASATTNANGKASTVFTSSTTLGNVSVLATTLSGSAVFNINVQDTAINSSIGSMILVTSGSNQNVEEGTTASRSLEVMAVNSLGSPMSGVQVTYQVLTSGAGTLTSGATTATTVNTVTGISGRASVTFNASSQLGHSTVIASSNAGSAVFNLQTISAGSNSTLTISGGNGQTINQSSTAAIPLEVVATDSTGSPVAGVAVTFNVTTADGGTLSNTTTTVAATTNANGKASTTFTSGTTSGIISVLASSVSGSAVFNITVRDPAAITASGSMLLVTSGNNQSVPAGTTAGTSLQVMAVNAQGAAMNAIPVTFEMVTSGAGTLTGGVTSKTVNTGSNGRASVDFTASNQVGSASVIVTSSAGNAVFNLNVLNATPTQMITISGGNNQTIAPSATASNDLEVIVTQLDGTPINGVDVTFTVTTSGGGTLSNSTATVTSTSDANGKASTSFTAGSSSKTVSVLATSTAGSAVFALNVANPSSGGGGGGGGGGATGSSLLITNGNNQVLEQGIAAPTNLEVLAVDSTGSPIPNVTVYFQVGSGLFTGGGTTASAITGSNGRANIGYTASNNLGPISVIATSTAGSAVFNLIIGVQGAGSSLSISSGNGQLLLPSSTASAPLEVIATNASGSPVANVPVTFTVTTTNGGTLSNSTATVTVNTNANGKASTTFTSSNTTGSISVLASSSVGSVTFSLNTNPIGGGNGGGGGSPIVFSPTTLVPASTTWVNVEVGSSPTKTVTVTNSAATSVYVNSIFTTSSAPFSRVSDTCPRSPNALASAATCTITIAFSPIDGDTVSKFMFVNWSSLADGSNGTNAVLSLEGSGPSLLSFAGISSATNITTNSVQLNWTAASGGTITQYRVYNTTGTATQIATLPANSNTYTVTGLNANTTYKFRVYAVNSAGTEDGNTNDATITTLQLLGPELTMAVTSPSADTGFNNWVFPNKEIRAGFDTFTADVNSSVTGNDTGPNGAITYTCKFSRNSNSSSSGKSTCSAGLLGGAFTFNSATGAISWTPRLGTQGLFEFEIKGTDVVGPTYRYFLMNVGHPYSTTQLPTILADYRASFSNMYDTHTGTTATWADVSGNGNTATISGTPNWAGAVTGTTANTIADPQRHTFDGNTEVNLGSLLAGLKSFMIDFWISNPENDYGNGSVVLKMDTDNTDNGFKVTQNTNINGKRMLRFDFERSYARAIAVDNPSLHWRLDEASGTTFADLITSNAANQLSYVDSSGSPTSTGLVLSQGGATLGEQSSTAAIFHTNRLALPTSAILKPASDFSVEFWVRYTERGVPADHTLYTLNSTGTANGLSIYMANGVLTAKYKPSGAATVTLTPTYSAWGHLFDQNWHHVVFTSVNNSKILYLDGVVLSSSATANGAITWPTTPDLATVVAGADSTKPVMLDEIAFYGFALSSNQVKNHLAAGDHFIRNQALFPANSVHQAKPTGYWRMGEGNQGNYQDSSGNQNNLFDSDWATYPSPYGGVYMRTGGSGLDNDGASYQHESAYKLRAFNMQTLTFNDKFTYTGWINVINYPSSDRYIPFFSWSNNGANTYGFYAYLGNDGTLNAFFDRTWSSAPHYIRSTGPVMPAGSGSATSFPLGWYHVAMTYDGTKTNNERVNFYINGAPVKMTAATGTIPTSLSTLTNFNWEFELGTWHVNNGQPGTKFNTTSGMYYSHDEDAIYDRVLTASEIRAQANEASLRYCDVNITSQQLDPINTKPFDYVNMLFDGATLTIKRNSRLECALRPGINLVGESLPIKVGATNNGFRGHIADLRVHGADVGVTVATITDAHNAFMQSSDQHRTVPLGNIVTTNLVRNYEASAANDGVRGYSPGCEISKSNWYEVGHMTNGNLQEPGYLYNWTTCTTGNGWNGDGTPTNPYRLTFNGTGNWVDLGTDNAIFPYALNKMSGCVWLRTTHSSNFHILTRQSGNYNYGDFDLVWENSSYLYFFLNYGSSRGNGNYVTSTTTANSQLRNGFWHYLCGVYDGTKTYMYMDGANVGTSTPGYTGNVFRSNSMNARLTLGSQYDHFYNFNWGGWYKGDIGAVHIYNDGLTAAQVKQNCNAQAANYNMTTCAP